MTVINVTIKPQPEVNIGKVEVDNAEDIIGLVMSQEKQILTLDIFQGSG